MRVLNDYSDGSQKVQLDDGRIVMLSSSYSNGERKIYSEGGSDLGWLSDQYSGDVKVARFDDGSQYWVSDKSSMFGGSYEAWEKFKQGRTDELSSQELSDIQSALAAEGRSSSIEADRLQSEQDNYEYNRRAEENRQQEEQEYWYWENVRQAEELRRQQEEEEESWFDDDEEDEEESADDDYSLEDWLDDFFEAAKTDAQKLFRVYLDGIEYDLREKYFSLLNKIRFEGNSAFGPSTEKINEALEILRGFAKMMKLQPDNYDYDYNHLAEALRVFILVYDDILADEYCEDWDEEEIDTDTTRDSGSEGRTTPVEIPDDSWEMDEEDQFWLEISLKENFLSDEKIGREMKRLLDEAEYKWGWLDLVAEIEKMEPKDRKSYEENIIVTVQLMDDRRKVMQSPIARKFWTVFVVPLLEKLQITKYNTYLSF